MSKICAHCGVEATEAARSCDNCGMPISEEAAGQEASTQQAAATLPPDQPSSPPAEQSAFDLTSPQDSPRKEAPPQQQENTAGLSFATQQENTAGLSFAAQQETADEAGTVVEPSEGETVAETPPAPRRATVSAQDTGGPSRAPQTFSIARSRRVLLLVGAIAALLVLASGGAMALAGVGPVAGLLGRSEPQQPVDEAVLPVQPSEDQEGATTVEADTEEESPAVTENVSTPSSPRPSDSPAASEEVAPVVAPAKEPTKQATIKPETTTPETTTPAPPKPGPDPIPAVDPGSAPGAATPKPDPKDGSPKDGSPKDGGPEEEAPEGS